VRRERIELSEHECQCAYCGHAFEMSDMMPFEGELYEHDDDLNGELVCNVCIAGCEIECSLNCACRRKARRKSRSPGAT